MKVKIPYQYSVAEISDQIQEDIVDYFDDPPENVDYFSVYEKFKTDLCRIVSDNMEKLDD